MQQGVQGFLMDTFKREQPPEVFKKKIVLNYFAKFIEKHLWTQSGDCFCFNKLRREFLLAKFVFVTNKHSTGRNL